MCFFPLSTHMNALPAMGCLPRGKTHISLLIGGLLTKFVLQLQL